MNADQAAMLGLIVVIVVPLGASILTSSSLKSATRRWTDGRPLDRANQRIFSLATDVDTARRQVQQSVAEQPVIVRHDDAGAACLEWRVAGNLISVRIVERNGRARVELRGDAVWLLSDAGNQTSGTLLRSLRLLDDQARIEAR